MDAWFVTAKRHDTSFGGTLIVGSEGETVVYYGTEDACDRFIREKEKEAREIRDGKLPYNVMNAAIDATRYYKRRGKITPV